VKRFKRILCAIDPGDESVLLIERAALLARRNNAELKVVGVVERFPSSPGTEAGFPSTGIRELFLAEARDEIERLVDAADTQGLPIRTELLIGSPFIELIREVLRDRHDLVIQGAEGKDGLKQRLFGSTTMHLMRKCPCPVWVMRSGHTRFERVMACVDPDPENKDPRRQALDHRILELSSSLAARESAELHVVHAWSLFGEQMLRKRTAREAVDQWKEGVRGAHQEELNRLVRKIESDGVPCATHLIKGPSREVLPSFAESHAIDLIVMGTVCRTGVAGVLIGNTAEVVLQQAQCSVLAVKPDGFLSPVTL